MSTPERLAVALANSTSEFLIVLDDSGGVRYANPAFSRAVLGGQAADGQNFFALVDEASAERGRETLAATLSSVTGERHQVELFHRCASQPRPIFYTFSKISAESGGALRLDGAESGGALRLDGAESGGALRLDGDEAGVAAVGHDKTADLEFLGEIVQLNMQLEEKQTELADANVRLEQLAITDQITGLYNRHYFFSVVQHIFEEARRYKLPLCCFMLDADHFKSLNDNYGHPFGDHVLRGIADRLRRATRSSDILARYGGEEFIMAAPGTDLKTAAFLAERLRSCIQKEVFAQGSTAVRVTISVGYAGTEAISAESFDDLLRAADKALYAAKLSGRNRVLAYQAENAAMAASGFGSSPEVRTTGPADKLR